MNVLHLIDTGGPGGAETMFAQLVSRWPGHVVAVVNRNGWLSEEIARRGKTAKVINSKGSFNFFYLAKLRKVVREENIDVIVAHLYGSCVYGSILGRLCRTPVIGVIHGQSDIDSRGLLNKLKAWLVRNGLDRLVCVSDKLAESLRSRLSVSDAKLTVIENGIDLDFYRPGITSESDLFEIGAIGNIRTPKRYDILLKAASIVCEKRSQVRFTVVGHGETAPLEKLRALRSSLKIDKYFHFAGFQSTTPNLYGRFRIVISSSDTEGFSLTCIEAMACGVPVIATRSGGPEDIIQNEKTGLLVPRGDYAAIAEATLRLMDDDEFREMLAANARESVINRFDISNTVVKYFKLCEDVCY